MQKLINLRMNGAVFVINLQTMVQNINNSISDCGQNLRFVL